MNTNNEQASEIIEALDADNPYRASPIRPNPADRRRLNLAEVAQMERQILRDEVEALLPGNALRVAKIAEDSERDWLRKMAALRQGGEA